MSLTQLGATSEPAEEKTVIRMGLAGRRGNQGHRTQQLAQESPVGHLRIEVPCVVPSNRPMSLSHLPLGAVSASFANWGTLCTPFTSAQMACSSCVTQSPS